MAKRVQFSVSRSLPNTKYVALGQRGNAGLRGNGVENKVQEENMIYPLRKRVVSTFVAFAARCCSPFMLRRPPLS